MGKKRDVVIDLAQFRADRERTSANGHAAEEALDRVMQYLPTVDELEAERFSPSRMLRFQCADGRTFFGIAADGGSGFFGAESADGTRGSLGDLEWFIVARHASSPPTILRRSDLEAIVASGIAAPTISSSVSTIQPLLRDHGLAN